MFVTLKQNGDEDHNKGKHDSASLQESLTTLKSKKNEGQNHQCQLQRQLLETNF